MQHQPSIRPAAVAGRFYPGSSDALASAVTDLLDAAQTALEAPKALIVPHAGYVYSGPVAANAYARLYPARRTLRRVILIGPSHRVPFRGIAASTAQAFATPLGEVPVDSAAVAAACRLPCVDYLDQAHAREHSLEVQLPFLQVVLKDFSVVPLVVGDAAPGEVAEVLEALWGGPETVVVVSSDLSHYHAYEPAMRMDAATAEAIEALDPDRLSYDDACGRLPIAGLLLAARRHGLRAETLDLRNSGDTAGGRDEVVGYGAFAFV